MTRRNFTVSQRARANFPGVEWAKFASQTSDDYRNTVLLQVASSAWADLNEYAEPSIYYAMCSAALKTIFDFICDEAPMEYFQGPDARREVAAELAREFLGFVFQAQVVQYCQEQLMEYMRSRPCGPRGTMR